LRRHPEVYQETSAEPSETSCLKLADGSFVKELESVQPISYQLAEDDAANFDKYLVPQQVGDKTIYVVVDKNILRSSVSASGLDLSNAKKLIRCDFNSKNCAVVQKTSKGRLIEECALVKKIKFGDELVDVSENKAELYNSFKEDYKKGEYKVDDVYLAGDKRELDSGDKRYEFTDETYHDDYAENLHAYKSLKTKNITIKDGKIEGGAKFSVGKGIAESYRVWGKALLAGVTLVPWLAVFGPIGVVAVAAYDVGVLAAAPLIPAVNAGIGIVRNNPMRKVLKYKDKTEHNRNKQASEIQTKLNELFANKTLSANDFDNALANIMNKIEMFAQTTSNNSLVVVDGKAEVNPNNANLANQYVADYKKAKKSYEAYKRKVDALIAAGKTVPADLQEKFRQSEAEFEALKNTTRGQDYSHDARLELLQNKAAAIRLCRCIESYPDSELVRGLSDELKSKLSYDAAHGLKIAGLSIDANENQIKRKFKKIDADILAWKALREEALKAVEQAKEIKSKEPKSENVESILSSALEEENVLNNALQQMNELINACEASYGSIDAILAEISDKYAIKGKLKSRADSIWEAVKNLRNNTEGLTLTKVEKRIEKINQKVEDLKEMETEANTAKTLTNSIETEIGEFSVIHERIKSICSSLGGDEKEQNLKEVEGYVESTLNAYKAAQKDKTTANLEVQLNNILANKEKANTLYETIIELDKEATKNAMIEEVGKSYQEAVRLITLLDETEIKSIFGSFVSTLTNAKRLIKKFENNIKLDESTIKDAVTAKNKAGIVVQLIDFGVKSLMVMELVRKTYGAEEQSRVGRIIGEMAQYMIVSEETTIGMLNDNLNNAKSKYERELLPYLTNVEKKDEKKDEEPKKLPKEKKNKVEQPKVKEEPKTDMVRLAGEKQIRDKLNTLLSDKNSWTEEDEHIHSLLLTATKLSEKELNKKMASIALKLTQNLNETKNTKFSKGYLPYVIVETIAEELHLDKKMFDIDPNQYSMLDINNDQNPTLFVE